VAQGPDQHGWINRQDAKFAKVVIGQPPISWRSWLLGGKKLEVCRLAISDRRVSVLNKKSKVLSQIGIVIAAAPSQALVDAEFLLQCI
jgi:hypothetical protein